MTSAIHRTELSKMVAERLGISHAAASDARSAVLDSIGQALCDNERVPLTGFGTFSVRERAARRMLGYSREERRDDDRTTSAKVCEVQGRKHPRTGRA